MKATVNIVAFLKFLLIALVSSASNVTNDDDDQAKLWAVLVAGSNEYYNYRHQADICHAYQILHAHGIPDERIIVMMYDDIAYNDENPTQGVIVNRINGSDVYKGVPKDYTGSHVTPKNFLNVLLGKQKEMEGIGTGKVLKSGPNDHVFVNFADHGAPGLLAFPDGQVYARQLLRTLEAMSEKKMYKKMVIYVEACESGSMFENKLPANISTANSEESSYACYYDDVRQTYLGDVYSVNWMEDSDSEDIEKEKLQKQFRIVKSETNTSHAQHFGDLTIGKLVVGQFQGKKEPTKTKGPYEKLPYDAVPSPEVPLFVMRYRLRAALARNDLKETNTIRRKLLKLESNRKFLSEVVSNIVNKSVVVEAKVLKVLSEKLHLNNMDCYEDVVEYFNEHCFSLSKNDYALRQLYVFVNMCEMGIKPKAMKKAMDLTCYHPPIYGIY